LILDTLNEEQQKAVSSGLGHNLVIASAGTGKTSTIVARVAYLLKSGVKAENIMLLTFTNKASAEILKRVSNYFPDDVGKITAGTFHSISYKLLKKKDFSLNLKTSSEFKNLLKTIYDKYLLNNSDAYSHGYIYDIYSLYLNTFDNESFEEYITKTYEDHKSLAWNYQQIIDEFEEVKRHYKYVGFDDLLTLGISSLKENGVYFDEVLVDEYQDTNPLQGKFIDVIEKKSLFCVGDYDQSIYAFNGADIKIISTFRDRYENTQIHSLSKNYRSTSAILDLANRVIIHNERIYHKSLEVIRKSSNIPPKLLIYSELYEQYEKIAQRISKSNTSNEEIAVIFRNNSSADGIESTLRKLDIKVKRKGGISFFNTKEIKIIFDILSLLTSGNDLMSFINIFSYNDGIGEKNSQDIFKNILRLGNGDLLTGLLSPNDTKVNVQQSLIEEDNKDEQKNFIYHQGLSKDSLIFIEKLKNLLKDIRYMNNPEQVLNKIIESKFYKGIKDKLNYQRSIKKDGNTDELLAKISDDNINRKTSLLVNIAKPYKTIKTFINAMVLGSNEITNKQGVNLLSVHSSKGLEFEEVYIIDLMEGRFPNTSLMSKNNADLDEERRLFYVAVTRAKDILYLSLAKYDKIKKISYKPSIFLKEAQMIL